MTESIDPVVSVLSDQDKTALWRVLGRFPADWRPRPHDWESMTTEDLITVLTRMADGLDRHYVGCHKRDRDLDAHIALIAGGRRLIEAFVPALQQLGAMPVLERVGQALEGLDRARVEYALKIVDQVCTHGDGCPVHPHVRQVHNFDHVTPPPLPG